MKKTVTPKIVNRLNYLLDTVCKYLAEEKYDEANKLQEEYYEIENEYDLFDQTYEEHGKLGIKDITGKILVPAIYSNYSELYSYTIKRGAPVAAQNDEGKFALVSTNGSGLPLCDFIYDLIVCKHYTSFYTCIKEVDGKRLFGLLTAKGKEIVPCEMDLIYNISNDIIVFKKDEKFGLVTSWGLYLPPVYEEITADENEFVHVSLNGQWGHVSNEGVFIPDDNEETFDNTHCLSFGIDD